MKQVDYAKLSEQYASFLVAIGGVSITMLTLVLGLSSGEANARLFLAAALISATVSCFIGAHMMAETAAFFTHRKESAPEEIRKDSIQLGSRLFVLASCNIFIATTLVLFSLVLLPAATGNVKLAADLNLISRVVFLSVVVGALLWMAFAAIERMEVGAGGWAAIGVAVVLGSVVAVYSYRSKGLSPQLAFIFIVGFTAVSVIYFAGIFWFGKACSRLWGILEIAFFSSSITISYVFLVVAYFKILRLH